MNSGDEIEMNPGKLLQGASGDGFLLTWSETLAAAQVTTGVFLLLFRSHFESGSDGAGFFLF